MKKILLYFVTLMTIWSFVSPSFTEVVRAIKTGNASEVSKYFDNTVEITLPEKSNSYSKSQAELVLHDFFASNEVKDFEILHQSENPGSQYCIGNLQTINGLFRTTIFMKQKGDRELVQELRFEK
jgi:antitoxin component YwqK of YwqJK toxin-antitoxin module